ncbi:MAG: hypothetical protein B6D45_06455 [Ignavibacteriales bacterium UTCHB3]|nr:MAG: hypothetical protein B6D45_06455 [Ignavibacteriales bacterium UTCHB3]
MFAFSSAISLGCYTTNLIDTFKNNTKIGYFIYILRFHKSNSVESLSNQFRKLQNQRRPALIMMLY